MTFPSKLIQVHMPPLTEARAYKAEVLAGNKPALTPEQAVAMMPDYP